MEELPGVMVITVMEEANAREEKESMDAIAVTENWNNITRLMANGEKNHCLGGKHGLL